MSARKPEPAEIDAQQRNVECGQDARRGQQRAVAAEHDAKVGAFGRQTVANLRIEGGVGVGPHLRPANPAAQLRQCRAQAVGQTAYDSIVAVPQQGGLAKSERHGGTGGERSARDSSTRCRPASGRIGRHIRGRAAGACGHLFIV